MCIANVKYKKPTQNDQNRSSNLLSYLTYREGSDENARQESGKERWVNHGMGNSVAKIIKKCDAYRSDHVLLFSIVLNPNPNLVAMIPHDQREAFLHQLTANTLDDFFVARGIDTGVECSWVLHHRMTEDEDSPGRHNPHTHIVLPGTYYDADEGRRVPLYFSRNKHINHIDMLHDITQSNMELMLDRYVGRDWEDRYDLLHPEQELARSQNRSNSEIDLSIDL